MPPPPPPPPGPAAPAVGEPGRFVAGGVSYELSGWWPRVGAGLIDFVIVWVIPVLIGVGVGLAAGWVPGLIVGGVALLAGWLYPSIMMWKTDGRTVGKRAANIRVVQESGQPFDAGTAFLREFVIKGLVVSIANGPTSGLAGLINVLWPLWDDQNRAVHDMIVKTPVVVDQRAPVPTAQRESIVTSA
ncbi:MAG: RDD family protein [Ilumatobacter sp.]|uniref:RDD family protein n=1 Tax=Ilumatobacter sp. TaxID=1967498 RepID=UPI00262C53B0|nr:RDD family protein [Ilumatobacter sp.]MDJ0770829.1 RDD family protein [Ilumatobacter sp.]